MSISDTGVPFSTEALMKLDGPRDSALTMITADDNNLRQNILAADFPTLLATVFYLTRDPDVLRPEWKPTLEFGVAVSGLSADEECYARAYCFDRLVAFRDSKMTAPHAPTYDDVENVGRWLMGETIEPFLQLTLEEMVVADHDPRRPRWSKTKIAKDRSFSVGIIGAGESGLLMGIRLRQAGVPFVIYEKIRALEGHGSRTSIPVAASIVTVSSIATPSPGKFGMTIMVMPKTFRLTLPKLRGTRGFGMTFVLRPRSVTPHGRRRLRHGR